MTTADERAVLEVLKHTYLHHEPGATLPEAWFDALLGMPRDVLLRALGADDVKVMNGIGVVWTCAFFTDHPEIEVKS